VRSAQLRSELARAPWPGERSLDGAAPSRVPLVVAAGAAVAVALGLVLRFWTHSDMWLDEALTVNVARVPLHDLTDALRRDGAPPLYYVLLHFWMRGLGTGDLATRSLAGIFGVLSLPLMWFAGRRLGGRSVAWAAALLLASSPFAIRYSTENRMYSLLIFLTLVGYLALTSALRKPRPGNLVVLGLTTAALLYTHYWALYLVFVVGGMLLYRAVTGSREARRALGAVVAGCVLFVPWLPILSYQLRHTGTPWAVPASFSAMVHAVGGFAGGDPSVSSAWDSSPTRGLGLIFLVLVLLAVFGAALDARRIELDLRTRPRARSVAFVTAAVLLIAIVVGRLSGSTFIDRYTAVVFSTFVLVVALGVVSFKDRRIRYGVVAVAAALGLAVSLSNVGAQRSQAAQVASAIDASARPGDVVGYCPDQLGPAVSRLVTADVAQTTFPRQTPPQIVNWVDYAEHSAAGNPGEFARHLVQVAGPTHTVWLVWAPGYRTLGSKCQQIEDQLGALRPSTQVVAYNSTKYYEFADLVRYPPQS
jgi:mannosyltransferase